MGVFDAFAATGGVELSLEQLNEKTKGDKDLLGKMIPSKQHNSPSPSQSFVNMMTFTLQSELCASSLLIACSPNPVSKSISPSLWLWRSPQALRLARLSRTCT